MEMKATISREGTHVSIINNDTGGHDATDYVYTTEVIAMQVARVLREARKNTATYKELCQIAEGACYGKRI